MAEEKFIKLTGNFYFDPAQKAILRRTGDRYSFVLHDRRRVNRPVVKDRRAKFDAMPVHLKPIAQGLFWNAETKEVFRKIGNNYVLYSKDRRSGRAPGHGGQERRGS